MSRTSRARRLPFFAAAVVAASAGAVAVTPSAALADPAAEPVVVVPDAKTVLNGLFRDIAADPAHQQVFVATYNPSAVVALDSNGVVKQTVGGFTAVMDLVLNGDGSTLYVLDGNGTRTLTAIDTQTYAATTTVLPGTDCARTGAFTGGKLWYSYGPCDNSDTGGIGVFDPATGIATTGVVDVKPGRLAALPDRPDLLFLAETGAGGFHLYDVSGETPNEVATGGRGYCGDAVLTPDGERVLVSCGDLEVYRTSDLSLEKTITTPGRSESVALSADGRFAAVSDDRNPNADSYLVHDLDTAGAKVVREFKLGTYEPVTPRSVAFLGDTLVGVIRENSRESVNFKRYATKAGTALTAKAPKGVRFSDRFKVTGTMTAGPAGASVAVTRTDRTGVHDLGTITVPASGAFTLPQIPSVTGVNQYTFTYAGDDGHQPAIATASVIIRPRAFDFNNDGYAETVTGAPGEDLGDDTDTGQLYVLPGTASGTTGTGSVAIHQDVAGVPGSNEDGDFFGEITASGDFNGDGYADLAASLVGEDLGSAKNAGSVLVFYGSATGLKTSSGVGGLSLSNAYGNFGVSMAAGDFNGDGIDDLAVGEPGTYYGSVTVFPGAVTGLNSSSQLYFNNGHPGDYNENELFGYAMSAGDINGDGFDDLAVGSMYDWEARDWSTGSVSVFYGMSYGFGTTQFFTKDTSGVPGGSASFNPDKGDSSDMFGAQVVLADFNGDTKADLAVSAPGSPVTGTDGKRKADAGTVTVLYSDGTKIATSGAVQYTQSSTGLPGNPGSNDFYGSTLTAGDGNRDGYAELAIYSSGDAFVTIIPGGASGLATSKATAWSQDSPGIPGGTETGDYWGGSLRFVDVKGTGYLTLVVGASGEDKYGALTVMYFTAAGATGTGSKFFSQDTAGIPGGGESGDGFGTFW
ncbi:MAG TPA: FG-GAP repeat protein [Phytomonospora sp.]